MNIKTFFGLLIGHGWASGAVNESDGYQRNAPSIPLVRGTRPIPSDAGLQISSVWACVNLLSQTIASLPIDVFGVDRNGNKRRLRDHNLCRVLRSPNSIMTPHDFWACMSVNRFLRGNGYARIVRARDDSIIALIPLASEQMEVAVVDGKPVYQYQKDGGIEAIAERNVLHWKGIGNGFLGLNTLDYMRPTATEQANAQQNATQLYGNGNSMSGLLVVDRDLDKRQIAALKERYSNLTPVQGDAGDWLKVLPGWMRFQQVSMSAADSQLLETRQFGIDEVCRFFGVPSPLVGGDASGATLEQLTEAFYRQTVAPECAAIEQAVQQKLVRLEERDSIEARFRLNALQRANPGTRYASYAQALQNGFLTRNEVRALEDLEPVEGADQLTAQSNLVPLDQLGQNPSREETMLGEPVRQ